jgi:hypothetical protein
MIVPPPDSKIEKTVITKLHDFKGTVNNGEIDTEKRNYGPPARVGPKSASDNSSPMFYPKTILVPKAALLVRSMITRDFGINEFCWTAEKANRKRSDPLDRLPQNPGPQPSDNGMRWVRFEGHGIKRTLGFKVDRQMAQETGRNHMGEWGEFSTQDGVERLTSRPKL